uniref:Rad21/Rec8-like protein N-terminal domain-containing protein n=1 Tax=Glossina morsitans morsitans TaxID=37546 RepID=A0A1B0FH38_GLOMM
NKLLLNFDPKVRKPFDRKERRLCSVKQENVVPFRMFSQLFYGTLKIYQQQVDNLLKSTENLLKESDICGTKIIKNLKRKSASDLDHGGKNKRRRFLAKSQISTGTSLTTNYNYLFDDMENLAKQTITDSITEISTCSKFTGARQVTQLQIREFTIREINTQTYYEVPKLDDDYGFGEIINQGHEDLKQINEFISNPGNEIEIPKQDDRRVCKRKDWQAYGVMIKLLDIWRYSNMSKIDAIEFCHTPKYLLAAKLFIEITKRINSIEMDEIKLGSLSEKLINAHYHIK